MLFDTHAHMDDRAFDADRTELLTTSLPQAGIALLNTTTSMPPSAPIRMRRTR